MGSDFCKLFKIILDYNLNAYFIRECKKPLLCSLEDTSEQETNIVKVIHLRTELDEDQILMLYRQC